MNKLVNEETLGELGFEKLNSPNPIMSLWICEDFECDHHIYLRWSARLGFYYGPDHRPCPIPIFDLENLIKLLEIIHVKKR